MENKEESEEKFVKVCPKCSSLDLKSDMTMAFLGELSTFICKDCGYTNTFFPEIESSKLDEFKASKQ